MVTEFHTKITEATPSKVANAVYNPIATKIVSFTPGRFRLKISRPYRQPDNIKTLATALENHPQVSQVQTNPTTGSIVVYHSQETSADRLSAILQDLGLIYSEAVNTEKSETAEQVVNATNDLNRRVLEATNGLVDLRLLIPLGFGTLAIRQLLVKGLLLDSIPAYVFLWYAFDSFIKLHYTSEPRKDERL